MSAVSRRYARALFALAKEAGTVSPTAAELERVATLAAELSVSAVLRNPLLSPAHRLEFAQTLARESAASPLLIHFVCLLADHQRLAELPAIHQYFQNLLDQELGRVRVTIRSPGALTPQQQSDLVATFTKITGKQVIPTIAVDPDLLGGVVVEAEGKVYDGSVRTQLDRLAKELTGTASS
jgi:F-type H+-transporting ATPase subunit delta